MHDFKDELWTQFFNFDCFKIIVENAGFYIYVRSKNDNIPREKKEKKKRKKKKNFFNSKPL